MSDNFLTLPISDIVIENRYRKEFGDIQGLANDINKIGLIVSITVKKDPITGKYILVDGQRRILAAQRLRWTEIDCYLIDLKEIVFGEYSANTFRKNFVPSEAVRIKKAIEPYEKQKAIERELAGKKPSGKIPQGKTRDIVAKQVGFGERTLKKAEEIVDAADQESKYQYKIEVLFALQRVAFAIEQAISTFFEITKDNEIIYEVDFEKDRVQGIHTNYNGEQENWGWNNKVNVQLSKVKPISNIVIRDERDIHNILTIREKLECLLQEYEKKNHQLDKEEELDDDNLKLDLNAKIKEELEKSDREQQIILKENKEVSIEFIIYNKDSISIQDLKIYDLSTNVIGKKGIAIFVTA